MRPPHHLLEAKSLMLIMVSALALTSLANAQPPLAADFTLKDTSGQTHSLRQYRGKVVVLEFFNPECPFIKRAHETETLKATIKMAQSKGIVWLAINANQPGRQGASLKSNVESIKSLNLSFPILLNPTGTVGRAYNATRTPEMVIVGKTGEIVYQGAVDSSGGSRHTKETVKYWFESALRQYLAGSPVTQKRTKPWGCSIKY